MGHHLHQELGDKYFAVATVVYEGTSLRYNDQFDFKHDAPPFLAYYLHQSGKPYRLVQLRGTAIPPIHGQTTTAIDNNGNEGQFIPNVQYDAILYLEQSGIPHVLSD